MANKAILYIDLLGVGKMWRQGGIDSVRARIVEFNNFVKEQCACLPAALHRYGDYTVILAGDGVSVMCRDYEQAIGIGCHLFVQAYYGDSKTKQPFWLRGAVSGWHNQHMTVNTQPINAKGLQIGTQYVNEDDFLAVLALEKSGFRGMRLIIDRTLLERQGRDYRREWPKLERPLGYVTRLRQCTYPRGDDFADVLWMTPTPEQYGHLKNIMASRFKQSTADTDEFLQASWTRAVFDQVDTLIWSCSQPRTKGLNADAAQVGVGALNQDEDEEDLITDKTEVAPDALDQHEGEKDPGEGASTVST